MKTPAKVTSVFFKEAVNMPGTTITGLKSVVIDAQNTKKAEMLLTNMGLVIKCNGKNGLVPLSNINCMLTEDLADGK